MSKFLKLSVLLMNRMNFLKKFLLIFILFFLPMIAAMSILVSQLNSNIKLQKNQRQGLEYNTAVRSFIQHVQQHRGLTSVYLGGKNSSKDNLTQKQEEIKKDINSIDSLDKLYGSSLNTTSSWNKIKSEWLALQNGVYSMSLQDAINNHTKLIADTLVFNAQVSDSSGLILESQLDRYYLVDTIVNKLPQTTEYMGQSRALGTAIISKKSMSNEERSKLVHLSQSITVSLNSAIRGMDVVYNEYPSMKNQLGDATSKAFQSSQKLVDEINNNILGTENITIDSSDYYNFATSTINDIYSLLNAESNILDSESSEQIASSIRLEIIAIITILAICALIIYLFSGFYLGIKTTIVTIEAATDKIAEGNLNEEINFSVKDETGYIINSLNRMMSSFSKMVSVSKIVAKDVNSSSQALSAITDQTTEATNQIALAIQEVANGAETQLQGTQQVTKVMENIAKDIQGIAENSTRASEESLAMRGEAEHGNDVIVDAVNKIKYIAGSVDETYNIIHNLGDRSKNIGQIVDVITGIASQTNLLALNAAIEAARAGEQGKGFAVVAEEVRKLAEQSAASAKQISDIIKEIHQDTIESVDNMEKVAQDMKEGLKAVDSAGGAFEKILTHAGNLADEVEKVSLSSQEISISSQRVVDSLAEVSRIAKNSSANAQTVAASTEEQLASMEEIAASSATLNQKAEELAKNIDKFKV